jgi:hypothetical protein
LEKFPLHREAQPHRKRRRRCSQWVYGGFWEHLSEYLAWNRSHLERRARWQKEIATKKGLEDVRHGENSTRQEKAK